MYSRWIVPLRCGSAFAFACGLPSHSSEVEPAAASAAPPATAVVDTAGQDVVASFEVHVGPTVDFALSVANAADRRVELTFPSGQTHEVVVLDSVGREVWRWSEGRLFTQALQTRLLGTGESTQFDERWSPRGRRGSFVAVATVRSSNYPVELRRPFTLP